MDSVTTPSIADAGVLSDLPGTSPLAVRLQSWVESADESDESDCGWAAGESACGMAEDKSACGMTEDESACGMTEDESACGMAEDESDFPEYDWP